MIFFVNKIFDGNIKCYAILYTGLDCYSMAQAGTAID